jgi:AcrR family transcriptional regulator
MRAVPRSPGKSSRSRRRYDGTLRRLKAAETRDRIVAAGSELLHGSPIRDWGSLTIRAVAEHAGVNERTVYRHFENERGLRDAVMRRLQEEAGIELSELRLEDVAGVATRIFAHVSAYPSERRAPLDPTLTETGKRQRSALLEAVAARAAKWPQADRVVAAAMLDVLWSVGSYERLVGDWQLGREQATRGITWVIGLVEEAVRRGRRPR